MTTYTWKGLKENQYMDGTVEALNKNEAAFKLRRDKIIITNLKISKDQKEKKETSFSLFSNKFNAKVKPKDLAIFTRKLATMVQAGLPILEALKIQIDSISQPDFKEVIEDVTQGVESGSELSTCLEKFPKTFDIVFVNLVRAGEASGRMDVFLHKLTESIERMSEIRAKVVSAMFYPAILVFVAISVIAVMLIKVVPTFQKMFSSAGSELPGPTLVVIAISDFLRSPTGGGLMVACFVALYLLTKFLIATNYGFRRATDALVLKIPIVKSVILESTFSRIAMLQGSLASAGVPLLDSLDIIGTSVKNTIIRESLGNIKRGVYSGQSVSVLYAEEKIFPDLFSQMIAIGEKTGRMEDMLTSIADFYQGEFNSTVERLTALLEPIMIVFMGVTIGGIMVAMYMPIFEMGKAI